MRSFLLIILVLIFIMDSEVITTESTTENSASVDCNAIVQAMGPTFSLLTEQLGKMATGLDSVTKLLQSQAVGVEPQVQAGSSKEGLPQASLNPPPPKRLRLVSSDDESSGLDYDDDIDSLLDSQAEKGGDAQQPAKIK